MINKVHKGSPIESRHIASIDIGSHTARLLIARETTSEDLFKPIVRKREYISLAEGFDKDSGSEISKDAIKRSLRVLDDFIRIARKYHVDIIRAVSTGIMRRAVNKKPFLDLILERTGIEVSLVSGEREARLTLKGVLHNLDISGGASVVFDLGGGTTEFIYKNDSVDIRSLPLGAVLLTQDFLERDPPSNSQMEGLSVYIEEILEEKLPREIYGGDPYNVIGCGGTVTTIASMVNQIDLLDITADRLNGLTVRREVIEELLSRIRHLPLSERKELTGLDKGRAGVILAGTMALIGILQFLRAEYMKVSYSDILEGILISYLQGEEHE